jgi:arylsulfatase A-like enzyme
VGPVGFDINSGPQNVLHRGEDLRKMGQPKSYHSYGSAWANTSNTPWRLYKHYVDDGGIRAPFIAHWPKGISRRNAIELRPGHINDLMPTCVELAGAKYRSDSMPPMEGRSLLPVLQGRRVDRGPLFWVHEANRAMRI